VKDTLDWEHKFHDKKDKNKKNKNKAALAETSMMIYAPHERCKHHLGDSPICKLLDTRQSDWDKNVSQISAHA